MNCEHISVVLEQQTLRRFCLDCGQKFTLTPVLEIAGNKELTLEEQIELEEAGAGEIQERFLLYHKNHPWVYAKLVEISRRMLHQGREHYGVGKIYEIMRWDMNMPSADKSSPFKLSNDYRSRYARLIMEQEADLRGFFRTRTLRRK